MSIFSEVGKLIVDEAKAEKDSKKRTLENLERIPVISAEDDSTEEVPPETGELVMDGSDTLRVVVINRVLSVGETQNIFQEELPGEAAVPMQFAIEEEGSQGENVVVAKGMGEITGNVIFPGNAVVSAYIRGDVSANGELSLYGTVDGNVEAEDVILCGTIHGSLKCRHLVLKKAEGDSVGHVDGSLSVESLSMDL